MNVLEPLDLMAEGDFTRGSIAAEVVSDALAWRAQDVERTGIVEAAARNLCPDAERWDRAGWTLVGMTRSATAGPDAAGMAWLLTETTETSRHGIERTITVEQPAKTHSITWIIKPGSRPAATFAAYDGATLLGSAHVRWSDLTVVASTGVTASAAAYAAGFYKVVISLVLPATPTIGVYASGTWPFTDDLPRSYLGNGISLLTGAICQVEASAATSPIPTEGSIWAPRLVSEAICNALAVSGSNWLAGADNGVLQYSTNGVDFSGRNSGFGGVAVTAVRKVDTYWLVGGAAGKFARSLDAVKFSAVTIAAFADKAIRAIAGTTTALVVGDDGAAASSASPYSTWTTRTIGLAVGEHALCAAFHGSNWFVGGDQGTLRYSAALSTWATATTGLTAGYAIRGLYSDGTTLVAVGDFGSIATSTDGITWAVRTSGTTRRLNAVTKFDGRWWAVGDRVVLVSADGVTWMPRNRPGATVEARAVVGAGASLMIAGARPGLSAYVTAGQGLRAADVPARLISPILENDAPTYSTDESYVVGDIVQMNHRRYEALQDSKNIWPTDALDVYWLDLGPTNKWAWSDTKVRTQTIYREGTFQMDVRPGRRIDTIGFVNTQGSSLTVEILDGNTAAVKQTKAMPLVGGMASATWHEFFFASRAGEDNGLVTGILCASIDTVRITITPLDGEVKIGFIGLGVLENLGVSVYGSNIGIMDFSVHERDEWGNAILRPGDYADRLDQDFEIENRKLAAVKKRLTQLRAKTVLWAAALDVPSTIILGVYEEFEIVLEYWSWSTANISLRGMT